MTAFVSLQSTQSRQGPHREFSLSSNSIDRIGARSNTFEISHGIDFGSLESGISRASAKTSEVLLKGIGSSSGLEEFDSGLAFHCWFCGSAVLWRWNRGTAEPANDNRKRFSAKPYWLARILCARAKSSVVSSAKAPLCLRPRVCQWKWAAV